MNNPKLSSDKLNEIGQSFLKVDPRYVALIGIVSLIILAIIKRLNSTSKKWPSMADMASAILSLLSLYSAMVIAAIFLFTRPPAINELDDLTLITVGMLSFVYLGFLAISEVYTRFIK